MGLETSLITFAKAVGQDMKKKVDTDDPRLDRLDNLPAWSQEPTKPAYTAVEVGAAPLTHTHSIGQVEGLQDALANIVGGGAFDNLYVAGTGLHLDGFTFSLDFGDGSGQAVEGNDERLNQAATAYGWGNHNDVGYVTTDTTYSAGAGLSLIGNTFSASFGNKAGTITQGNDPRLADSRPASDVSAWAKAASKPTYTAVEVGAASSTDSRLTDAREWTAGVVSQAEAEAGTDTTARKWTAQRVRQAIVAWFNGISGALGRTILSRTTAAQVRGDIGLGTAATMESAEVTARISSRDFTEGTLISTNIAPDSAWLIEIRGNAYEEGGLPFDTIIAGYDYGGNPAFAAQHLDNGVRIPELWAMYIEGKLSIWFPGMGYWQGVNVKAYNVTGAGMAINQVTNIQDAYKPTVVDRERNITSISAQSITTSSITQSTGQSTLSPMSQKAVTDAVAPAGTASAEYHYTDGRVSSVVTSRGTTAIMYNASGLVTSIKYPTGRQEHYSYSPSGEVTNMQVTEV